MCASDACVCVASRGGQNACQESRRRWMTASPPLTLSWALRTPASAAPGRLTLDDKGGGGDLTSVAALPPPPRLAVSR